MKSTHIATLGSFAVLSLIQTQYVFRLRSDVHALSDRVAALSASVAQQQEHEQRQDPPRVTARDALSALGAGLLREHAGNAEGEQRGTDERVREVVSDEMKKRAEQQRLDTAARLDQVTDEVRQSVARELDASDLELARIEELGNALRDSENALAERSTQSARSGQDVPAAQAQLVSNMERDVERILGASRYAKFTALRLEHPEFGRSLYVLRSAPPQPTRVTAELTAVAAQPQSP